MLATEQATAQISPADQTFATKGGVGSEAEVVLDWLATDKAESGQARQFCQQMVTDHSQVNEELQAIAKRKNLTLPTKPDAVSRATEQRLQASSGIRVRHRISARYASGPSAGCCELSEGGPFPSGSRAEGVGAKVPADAAPPSTDGPAD